MKRKTETQTTEHAARRVQRLVRPPNVPVIDGCPPDCGHSDEEHIAFDMGVYDGERDVTVPPVECSDDTEESLNLREAWLTGWSVGRMNRPNAEVTDAADAGAPTGK